MCFLCATINRVARATCPRHFRCIPAYHRDRCCACLSLYDSIFCDPQVPCARASAADVRAQICSPRAPLYPHTLQPTPEERQENSFTRRYIVRAFPRTWVTMIRHNIVACFRDTRTGILGLHPAATASAGKTGPYPALDPNDTSTRQDAPRRPGANVLGTYHTPVVVRANGRT